MAKIVTRFVALDELKLGACRVDGQLWDDGTGSLMSR
jgi:hypothetical protein